MSSFTTPLQYVATGLYEGFGNRPTYRITEAFSYAFGSLDQPLATFTVPVGFVTDLASIPWPFSLVFHPDGPWSKAAVLHDWLCYQTSISKVVQDSIFYEAMKVLDINEAICITFFLAVRIFRGIKSIIYA